MLNISKILFAAVPAVLALESETIDLSAFAKQFQNPRRTFRPPGSCTSALKSKSWNMKGSRTQLDPISVPPKSTLDPKNPEDVDPNFHKHRSRHADQIANAASYRKQLAKAEKHYEVEASKGRHVGTYSEHADIHEGIIRQVTPSKPAVGHQRSSKIRQQSSRKIKQSDKMNKPTNTIEGIFIVEEASVFENGRLVKRQPQHCYLKTSVQNEVDRTTSFPSGESVWFQFCGEEVVWMKAKASSRKKVQFSLGTSDCKLIPEGIGVTVAPHKDKCRHHPYLELSKEQAEKMFGGFLTSTSRELLPTEMRKTVNNLRKSEFSKKERKESVTNTEKYLEYTRPFVHEGVYIKEVENREDSQRIYFAYKRQIGQPVDVPDNGLTEGQIQLQRAQKAMAEEMGYEFSWDPGPETISPPTTPPQKTSLQGRSQTEADNIVQVKTYAIEKTNSRFKSSQQQPGLRSSTLPKISS